ncbi:MULTISPECIES: sigma-70 family RNA polymerase sigma factor [Pseudomonas]|uniref:sigma-70 family RNA polymerase sigma factor n=1 Tax=Pseudomonas TaxID=286 RepID=UPI00064C7D4B|nr:MULTISPECIES: sigma-70 family RNA polymerase sigma factor [Pseudomonas]MBP2839336.1 sigma-70 family RNA polymerase sigma factor [Pseudomonas sp. PNP]MCK2122735.1 sigma-70 family RNA polymerase sigma factor [Pseudomonas sp. PNPG3]QUN65195.1 sigma-70 family RNA polymerase sigma factor [Pseudomonas sp. JS425]
MSTRPSHSADGTVWPAGLLEHRRFLENLALLQLGNHADAQDALQETLLAAMSSIQSFTGRGLMRAWLVGILRHKVTDIFRRSYRFESLESATVDPNEGGMFTEAGGWSPARFVSTQCPQGEAVHQQALELVELCMHALPGESARLFLMREYLGMDIDEIVAQTRLTPGNLRVILHRARLRLRECVVRGWGELL